ncbi:FAD-dependent oxidoreductase [Micromonospora sp. M12]
MTATARLRACSATGCTSRAIPVSSPPPGSGTARCGARRTCRPLPGRRRGGRRGPCRRPVSPAPVGPLRRARLAGRALRDGGLVLDLTGLRDVRVDADAATVTVGGGTTAAELLAATRPDDLVVPTGVVDAVGMVGLTLAGGYGPLCGRFGLALDNLLGAEVVLADGRRVTADPGTTPSCTGRCAAVAGTSGSSPSCACAHRLPGVLAGMIMFALAEAPAVLAATARCSPRPRTS